MPGNRPDSRTGNGFASWLGAYYFLTRAEGPDRVTYSLEDGAAAGCGAGGPSQRRFALKRAAGDAHSRLEAIALSNAIDAVDIAGTLPPQGDCTIIWEKRGGLLIETQGRPGFGSTLIERVVPFEIGGKTEVAYPCESARARHVLEGDQDAATRQGRYQ